MRATVRLVLAGLAAVSGPWSIAAAADGEALYAANCSACHQPKGQGIPGAFPTLAGNVFVQGPPEQVAGVVLNGRAGMPAFGGDLSNADIAATLSYVRQAWGNKAEALAEAQVAAARSPANSAAASGALQAH